MAQRRPKTVSEAATMREGLLVLAHGGKRVKLPDVGLVDPHPERDTPRDHIDFSGHELCLQGGGNTMGWEKGWGGGWWVAGKGGAWRARRNEFRYVCSRNDLGLHF